MVYGVFSTNPDQQSLRASCVFVATKPLRYSACPRSQAHKGKSSKAGQKTEPKLRIGVFKLIYGHISDRHFLN